MSTKRMYEDDDDYSSHQEMMCESYDSQTTKRIKISDNDYFTIDDNTTSTEVYHKLLSILTNDGTVTGHMDVYGLDDVSKYVIAYRPSVIKLHAIVCGDIVYFKCQTNEN